MKLFVTILLMLTISISSSAESSSAFSKAEYIEQGDTLKYQILYPQGYDTTKQYPLVVFLHGAGERGNDNERQMALGTDIFLDDHDQKRFPAIVIVPQCPNGVMWTNRQKFSKPDGMVFEFPVSMPATRPAQLVDALVQQMFDTNTIDQQRVYIMGISMGGIGTLEFLYRWPEKYTAAFVVCGGHNPDLARYYADKPIWFAHGDVDPVVPMRYSKSVYDVHSTMNVHSKYSAYKGVNHAAWTPAFNEEGLLPWLWQFSK